MNRTGYRKMARKVIVCEECGRRETRPCNAIFCIRCSYGRASRHKVRVLQQLAQVPAWRTRHREYQRRWAAARVAREWPRPCVMCSAPVPKLAGRRRSQVMCERCRKEHVASKAAERRKAAKERRKAAKDAIGR